MTINTLLLFLNATNYDINLKITTFLLIALVVGVVLLFISFRNAKKLLREKKNNEDYNKL